MNHVPNRQPEGIPTGGQFAARHRAEGSVLLADTRHAAFSVGSLIRNTAATVKARALQRRPARTRPYSQRARMAVTALVLAASAASLTGCGTQQDNCQPAAFEVSAVQESAAASFSTAVEAKGGGHGGGHGSGHSTSHGTSSGVSWPKWFPFGGNRSSSSDKCEQPAPSSSPAP